MPWTVFVLGSSVFFMVGASAHLVARVTHQASPGYPGAVVASTVLAGLIVTPITIVVSYYLAIATFRFGWDPDNFSIPISSAVMDLAGVACVLFVMSVSGVIGHG